jgi:hypothetical protein
MGLRDGEGDWQAETGASFATSRIWFPGEEAFEQMGLVFQIDSRTNVGD